MAPSKCFVSFWFPVNNAIKTGVCGFVFIPNDDILASCALNACWGRPLPSEKGWRALISPR